MQLKRGSRIVSREANNRNTSLKRLVNRLKLASDFDAETIRNNILKTAVFHIIAKFNEPDIQTLFRNRYRSYHNDSYILICDGCDSTQHVVGFIWKGTWNPDDPNDRLKISASWNPRDNPPFL